MTYISLNYYIFIISVFFLYYCLPIKIRWMALLVGNVAFYFMFYKTGWWIFAGTIVLAYFAGLVLNKIEGGIKKSL